MVRQIKRKWRRFYRTHREGCELVGDFVGALSILFRGCTGFDGGHAAGEAIPMRWVKWQN